MLCLCLTFSVTFQNSQNPFHQLTWCLAMDRNYHFLLKTTCSGYAFWFILLLFLSTSSYAFLSSRISKFHVFVCILTFFLFSKFILSWLHKAFKGSWCLLLRDFSEWKGSYYSFRRYLQQKLCPSYFPCIRYMPN